MQIKAVLLDYGNVLGTFNHQMACESVASVSGGVSSEQVYQTLFGTKILSLRQTGALSEQDFFELVQKLFQTEFDFHWFRSVWGDIFTPAPAELSALLDRVDARVPMHVASNTESMHFSFIVQQELVQYLTSRGRLFASFKMGFEKPSQRFFTEILNQIECHPNEVLFIDDSSNNTRAFANLGGQVANFDLSKQSIGELEHILQRYQLLA